VRREGWGWNVPKQTRDMEFDDAFPLQCYINLNRRDDRRRTVLNMFIDHGMERVERFPAIDARTVRNCRGHWSEGRYALSLTQKLCLREAKRRKASAVMIFEDDVVLHRKRHPEHH
jgi:GR25 family glycosyltransferase involved in LPS biosynthesis